MKRIFIIFTLAAIILCFGYCTANSAPVTVKATTPAQTVIPKLIGNWTGSPKGYIEGTGYKDFRPLNITMSVSDQKDQCFSGHLTFPQVNGSMVSEDFAGVIWSGGKSFRIVEYLSGHVDGMIISPNELEMVFMDDKDPSYIMIVSLKRSM